MEWLKEAQALEHPMKSSGALGKDQLGAIDRILARGKEQTKAFRIFQMKRYMAVAMELAPKEAEIHKNMQPEVQSVCKGKRFLLMHHMMLEAGLDRDMADDLLGLCLNGFPITGQIKPSGLFSPESRSAAMSLREVWEQARTLQKQALDACRSSGDQS